MAAGGVWGSSSALIVAALAQTVGPVLYLVANSTEAESALDDFAAFGAPGLAFPEADSSPMSASDRMRAAQRLRSGDATIIVASSRAFVAPLPAPKTLDAHRIRLAPGDKCSMESLSKRLSDSRFERSHAVEWPGEYAIRGGILDIFPFTSEFPVRVELLGNTIDSIRAFRIADQHSTDPLPFVEFSLAPIDPGAGEGTLADYLPRGGWIAVRERTDIKEEHFDEWIAGRPTLLLQSLPVPAIASSVNFNTLSMQRFSGVLSNVARELSEAARGRNRILLYSVNDGEEDRLKQLFRDAGVETNAVELRRGRLSIGFVFEEAGLAFLSNHELFNRYRVRRPSARKSDSRPLDSLLELAKGDTVVHLTHGIGRFLGIERLERDGRMQDFVALEYHGGARVFVPVANIDLIQKYVGGSDTPPPLHTLGGTSWSATKLRAEESVLQMAQELLRVQALREQEMGIAYPADTEWQRAFEAAFPYEDTEDQATVTRAIKQDMESHRPMDRLICGDVGFGKTELAMRAAFKAATSNRQVAVLVPTTVLAQQHFETFRERMADYPVTVEVISRFKSKREQNAILKQAAEGKIDILIGTHRIVQADVKFKDLGLLVIDEEQRFGVEHKERLKGLRATVDVLTLTATPIPRTLHMSLLGIRDISSLATPPQDRMAIRTEVVPYDDRLIREAIKSEIDRGGQVYFVHNRVYSIDSVKKKLEMLVPEATFGVVHGQMDEEDLEQNMLAFLAKETDVLVATTIIESGLDIPNVNTILIDNADQFGLADLHQLRGRVGRYKVQAHCILLLPRQRTILPQARKRLKAIEEFSELGSGFRIAMRDIEIRGVGNLLGREQHGHIASVGYDLYLKMLEKAANKAKRKKTDDLPDTSVDLGFEAHIPESYIGDLRSRVEAYRKIVSAEKLDEVRAELVDRYGAVPETVENFIKIIRVKQLARQWKLTSLARGLGYIVATYLDKRRAEDLSALNKSEVRVVDDKAIHIYARGNPAGPKLADALIRLLALP